MKNKKSLNIIPLLFLFFIALSLATHFITPLTTITKIEESVAKVNR